MKVPQIFKSQQRRDRAALGTYGRKAKIVHLRQPYAPHKDLSKRPAQNYVTHTA